MSDLIPFGTGNRLPARMQRQTARQLSAIAANQAVLSAREAAKVEIIASVCEAALLATSHVSAVEALLVSRTPHAEGRLRHIADAGAIGMADVVMKAHRRVS